MDDLGLQIGSQTLQSRLIVGTGKYASLAVMQAAIAASGATMVTVAVRRLTLEHPEHDDVLAALDRNRVVLLPNTAGCFTAAEAVRTARLGRELGLSHLIKLEVLGDSKTLLPDTTALLEATRQLVDEGFVVMPYTNDDPVMAKKLEQAGAASVMPLAAPIGSGQGILNPLNIRLLIDAVNVPVIVDAGVGTASDAAIAMELGADGVLMNTAIADAQDPVRMAHAMRLAVQAGRLAYVAGRILKKPYANASSPLTGLVDRPVEPTGPARDSTASFPDASGATSRARAPGPIRGPRRGVGQVA